jgi:DNA-binding LacI/PurR family transcriptional regulator
MRTVIKMTMKELARLCYVSVSTVSKAFCEAEDVSEETKQLIFRVAKEQGCFGKFYKGKYHKKIIAIICHEFSSGYYSIFINKLEQLIENSGYICVISADNFNNKKQAELIEYYTSYLKVDGLIVLGLTSPIKKGYDIPIVSILSNIDSKIDSVVTDMESAIDEAVETLYALGHRNIAFLSEKLTKSKSLHFEKAIKRKKDCTHCIIESEKRFEEAGTDGINKLIEKNIPFTAVICGYDNIAIGAVKQLKNNGYSVPNDVSVVGIDNINTSRFTETSITSIDVNPSDICVIAFELMKKKLKNKHFSANQSIVIKPRLIMRESIGKVNHTKKV